jgi:hypothetical protein
MSSSTISDGDRYKLFAAAIDAHTAYIKDAMMGKAIDRHLLGLQIVAEVSCTADAVLLTRSTGPRAFLLQIQGTSPKPALFTDPLFLRSRKFGLSTSNVSTGNSATFGGCVRGGWWWWCNPLVGWVVVAGSLRVLVGLCEVAFAGACAAAASPHSLRALTVCAMASKTMV